MKNENDKQAAQPALPAEPLALIEDARSDIIDFLRASNDTDAANRVEEFMTARQIAKNIAAPGAAQTTGEPDRFTLDELADACASAEVSDSKYEALCIALQERAVQTTDAREGGAK
jgi:hypothetical protein